MVLGLAQLLAEKGIRVNGVLPGPIWTPFIPAGMSQDSVKTFGSQVPFNRPGQPAELASAYVMLAAEESSYTSGALITVAGGMPAATVTTGGTVEKACRALAPASSAKRLPSAVAVAARTAGSASSK